MNEKYKFDSISFGMRLAKIRQFYNMTQEQVAEYVDVSVKSIQNWEKGFKMPGIDNLVSLAECFGMAAGEILEDEAYRIFEKKINSRKRSIEIIEVKDKIEVFIEFSEDRFFDRYELWVWDDLAKFKYLYQSIEKKISYSDFKDNMLAESDLIVTKYREWLFSVLTNSEEDKLIKEAIKDKMKGEKLGMAAEGAVWNGLGKVLYNGGEL